MRFLAASEQAVLVYLGEEIGLATHRRVRTLMKLLQADSLPWVLNLQPAYCSLLVSFDLCLVGHAFVEAALRKYDRLTEDVVSFTPPRVEIPVCYGGDYGPDLAEVAAIHSCAPEDVVEIHTSQYFYASFLGFAPGFAYLGDLPERVTTPRLATPRKKVPAGSVAIAGRQTAVYPFDSPGGWRIIGRTPVSVFRADREPMGLISIGDEVRFFPITTGQFLGWKKL